jgi:hypothetical protein
LSFGGTQPFSPRQRRLIDRIKRVRQDQHPAVLKLTYLPV